MELLLDLKSKSNQIKSEVEKLQHPKIGLITTRFLNATESSREPELQIQVKCILQSSEQY